MWCGVAGGMGSVEGPYNVSRWRSGFFFFFSSRRRHTRCSRDWSSDVCSSDLLVGRRLRKSAVSLFCVGSVGVSFAYALGAVTQLLSAPPENRVVQHILFEWLAPGQMLLSSGQVVPFTADWGYLLDPLSSVMVLVVTGVGFLIHVYSIGYMGHEGGYYRFFGYMNLFMFSMLTLVLANNMLLMFVGWEGVGLR